MELIEELEYWNTRYYQAIHDPNLTEQQREELNRWRKECLREVNGEEVAAKVPLFPSFNPVKVVDDTTVKPE